MAVVEDLQQQRRLPQTIRQATRLTLCGSVHKARTFAGSTTLRTADIRYLFWLLSIGLTCNNNLYGHGDALRVCRQTMASGISNHHYSFDYEKWATNIYLTDWFNNLGGNEPHTPADTTKGQILTVILSGPVGKYKKRSTRRGTRPTKVIYRLKKNRKMDHVSRFVPQNRSTSSEMVRKYSYTRIAAHKKNNLSTKLA